MVRKLDRPRMSVDQWAPLIVGIGGTARAGSTSEKTVRRALDIAQTMGARVKLFDGPFVTGLPQYSTDRASRDPAETMLTDAIRACDGIIVATPSYHGTLSGPVKNAIDLIEDLARDERGYLDGRAFGAIVTAYGWQAGGTTLVTMRSIAHALRAWPTPFGAALNASTPLFDAEGNVLDSKVDQQIGMVAQQVVEFAKWRRAGLSEQSVIQQRILTRVG